DSSRVYRQADRAKAIAEAIESAGADDILLIAGKGHEQTQEINGEFLPFSDFAIVDQLQTGKN
ncbi:MAG: UDP-N-acetylmuramoyl-L-alanyl-D-glutamate--2,6-diaminopimelate ligase, partial [Pseudomonadota bacterium]|nr:UDP-N-acetylmuramoyl-L-alanyl-D-glutamate--2,6-diaminopimelate ligase [Pseudomonadota bacterium]